MKLWMSNKWRWLRALSFFHLTCDRSIIITSQTFESDGDIERLLARTGQARHCLAGPFISILGPTFKPGSTFAGRPKMASPHLQTLYTLRVRYWPRHGPLRAHSSKNETQVEPNASPSLPFVQFHYMVSVSLLKNEMQEMSFFHIVIFEKTFMLLYMEWST